MNVGIRELKAHLSEYIRKAAGMVEQGIVEGRITPPARSGLTPAVYNKASLSSMEVIDENRG